MTWADTLRLAFRNLGQARVRTALTVGGVAIGIASLSGLVSLGVGLLEQLVVRVGKSGRVDAITGRAMRWGRVTYARGSMAEWKPGQATSAWR